MYELKQLFKQRTYYAPGAEKDRVIYLNERDSLRNLIIERPYFGAHIILHFWRNKKISKDSKYAQ